MTSDGFTLYRFANDSANPPRSTCTGPCATAWPPVLQDATPTYGAVDPAEMGTVLRPDGTRQLTVRGWPVYRYAKDMAPGVVNGQGTDGVWAAVGGDGTPLRYPAPTTTAPTTTAPTTTAAAAVRASASATPAPSATGH